MIFQKRALVVTKIHNFYGIKIVVLEDVDDSEEEVKVRMEWSYPPDFDAVDDEIGDVYTVKWSGPQ